jgi:Asp-tRNA(Asn)/Glu-tRNA(Gln) amidotransferase A subunit family amidase
LLDRVRVVLTGRPPAVALSQPPVLGVARYQWDRLGDDARRALETAVDRAVSAGAEVRELELSASHELLIDLHEEVMGYEAVRSLAWEYWECRAEMSDEILRRLDAGYEIGPARYDELQQMATRARAEIDAFFGGVDGALTPAAPGEAPYGLDSTGDPRFCRLWTSLRTPAMSIPGLHGSSGLPIGVQVVGRPLTDDAVIAIGAWLYPLLSGQEAVAPVTP